MDKNRFDGFTRQLAKRENRRQALKTLFAGGAGTAAALMIGKETEAAKPPSTSVDCCPTSAPRLCGLICTATATDPNNCGACGVTCQPGQSCVNGACSPLITKCKKAKDCPSGQTCTNGVCAPPTPQRTSLADCPPTGNECVARTCTNGVCGTTNVASGTPLASQTDGDCQTAVCNGNGGTTSQPNDIDTPASGPCTTGTCTNGVPSNPPVSAGTLCDGGICDSTGACVSCLGPADCTGADNECGTRTCTNGTCGMAFVTAGTATSNQTTGDCQKNVCDGSGNIISVADNIDFIPPYYDTPCTDSICSNGQPAHPFLSAGAPCLGGGGICDGAGHCVQCLDGSDCPDSGVPNIDTICTDGNCSYQCLAGYTECVPGGAGCVDTSSDPNHCGGCNQPCVLDNATAICSSGTCHIQACDPGFGDCNGVADDGCEHFLSGDTSNCGACGNECNLPHVTLQLCSAGKCQALSCEFGWGNCDGDPATGCETDLSGDDDNCGGCGFPCQGSTHCVNGECVS